MMVSKHPLNQRKVEWGTRRRAHEEPDWGAFIVRFGLNNSMLRQMWYGPPRKDVSAGMAKGRYSNRMLTSKGKKSDTTYFVGVGGGFEINATQHVHLRFTTDYMHAALYDGFLRNARNDFRFSIGPSFNFGRNVANR